MADNPFHLMTPSEIEELFGQKYFYRQRVYRLAKSGKIPDFSLRGQTCFLASHVIQAFLKDLELRIQQKFPELNAGTLRVFYDTITNKRIVVDGIFGGSVSVNTETETEEELLTKIGHVIEWVGSQETEVTDNAIVEQLSSEAGENISELTKESSLADVLPEEIMWVRVDSSSIEGVEIKSQVLISLPSIAQFIGVRPDLFSRWISKSTFTESVLSIHYKQIQGTQNSVPWKRGIVDGYTPLIPFEQVPEIIVSFRQTGNTPKYQEKADLLYKLAKNTLEAVGLALSGTPDKAAEELAKVSKGLGITAADQILAIFKQYETREFQVQTTKEFNIKVKKMGIDYGAVIGNLTFGITGRYPSQWKAFGISRKLPKKMTTSSREVMRELSPSDSIGMTFGERHFIKESNVAEAVKTGQQGKDFYERLKSVGLLDEPKHDI